MTADQVFSEVQQRWGSLGFRIVSEEDKYIVSGEGEGTFVFAPDGEDETYWDAWERMLETLQREEQAARGAAYHHNIELFQMMEGQKYIEHTRAWLKEHAATQNGTFLQPTVSRIDAPIELIVPGRWQPRTTFDDAALADLAASIKDVGIKNPLRVFVNEDGLLELIAGERRLRAAQQVGLELLPVIIEGGSPSDLAIDSAMDNLQRENLSPLEEGRAFEEMVTRLEISEAELARRIGKNRAYIQQRRAIARAPEALQEALLAGKVSLTQARVVAQINNRSVQKKVQKQLLDAVGRGYRMKEEELQTLTRQYARQDIIKQLKKRGWNIENGTGTTCVIWSDNDRPRQMSDEDIVQLASEEIKPSEGNIPSRDLTDEERTWLKIKYSASFVDTYAPWLKLYEVGVGYTYVSPDEIPGIVQSIQADFERYKQAFATEGWRLESTEHSSRLSLVREGCKHSSRLIYWGDMEFVLEKARNGALDQHNTQQRRTCERCAKEVEQSRIWQDTILCDDCQTELQQRRQAKYEELRQELVSNSGASLCAVDTSLLREMMLLMRGPFERLGEESRYYTSLDVHQRCVNGATDEALREALLDRIALAQLETQWSVVEETKRAVEIEEINE